MIDLLYTSLSPCAQHAVLSSSGKNLAVPSALILVRRRDGSDPLFLVRRLHPQTRTQSQGTHLATLPSYQPQSPLCFGRATTGSLPPPHSIRAVLLLAGTLQQATHRALTPAQQSPPLKLSGWAATDSGPAQGERRRLITARPQRNASRPAHAHEHPNNQQRVQSNIAPAWDPAAHAFPMIRSMTAPHCALQETASSLSTFSTVLHGDAVAKERQGCRTKNGLLRARRATARAPPRWGIHTLPGTSDSQPARLLRGFQGDRRENGQQKSCSCGIEIQSGVQPCLGAKSELPPANSLHAGTHSLLGPYPGPYPRPRDRTRPTKWRRSGERCAHRQVARQVSAACQNPFFLPLLRARTEWSAPSTPCFSPRALWAPVSLCYELQ